MNAGIGFGLNNKTGATVEDEDEEEDETEDIERTKGSLSQFVRLRCLDFMPYESTVEGQVFVFGFS